MEIMVQIEHARVREEAAMEKNSYDCVTVTRKCVVSSCLTFTVVIWNALLVPIL